MDIIDFVKTMPVRQFNKGELLYTSGDISDTVMAIRTGYIKATSTHDNGRQKLLWIAGRYDIIPLERFFTRKVLQYDYIALSNGSAYQLKKADIHEMYKNRPGVSIEIGKAMSEHFDDALERLSAAGQLSLRSKLLHTLYNLSTKFSSVDIVKFHELGLNLTHQDLADMVGASREAVSLELSKIQEDGYIEYGRLKLTVHTIKIRDAMSLLA